MNYNDDDNDGHDNDANDDDNQEDDDKNDDEVTLLELSRTESRFLFSISLALNTIMKKKKKRLMMKKRWMKKKMMRSLRSLYEKVEEDAHVTLTTVHDTQKTDGTLQSSSISSDFTSKLLNLENPSPANNEIASLMDTTIRHKEPGSRTSPLYTVPVTIVTEITYVFTTPIPPPPTFFNPLSQQEPPTLTPTASETTTSFPALPDFSSVFKFNDRVTNLEKDLSEIKQVD
ncbi:hypothetical protein Tco_0524604 [Tanacetum coccineum]